MKKILVTGGSGFLGSRICYYYRKEYGDKYEIFSPSHKEMDFTDFQSVKRYADEKEPDMIIHCGAVSDTGYAESHPEESYFVNVTGTENLAKVSREKGIRLIFMSSDQIYNGRTIAGDSYDIEMDAAIEETDDCPMNEYAKQKKEAEQRSFICNPDTVALRLSWMYDIPRAEMKTNHNLITNIQQAAENGHALFFTQHEYRGITNVWEVIRNLEKALQLPAGVYNYGSPNTQATIEIARKAAEVLKLPADIVQEDQQRFADKPRNLTMSHNKLNKQEIYFNVTIAALNTIMKYGSLSSINI